MELRLQASDVLSYADLTYRTFTTRKELSSSVQLTALPDTNIIHGKGILLAGP